MVITLQNLTKIFPGKKKNMPQTVAVDDLSLSLPDGKLMALLGPSGCGKSTVLNMICGLLQPTSGRILFGDTDVTALPPEERGVGMVFQNYALYPHLTALQNICFPLENFKGKARLSKEEIRSRATEAAKLVQIEDYLSRRPGEMSGGQQQRVAIARALVKMPKVLLLDEPLSNLDARLRLQTREEIRRIQKETGITTIFVTHDQDEAMSISDVILVMRSGRLMQTGAPQTVYDDPADLFVSKFLGTPPINLFEGRVTDGFLFIGDEKVLAAAGAPDGPVTVGIRPEGFIPDRSGRFHCARSRVEVLGRDVSILSTNPACTTGLIRSIVDGDLLSEAGTDTVAYRLKPHKVFLFDKTTEERLPLTLREVDG